MRGHHARGADDVPRVGQEQAHLPGVDVRKQPPPICPGCGRHLVEFRGKLVCKLCGYHEHCCEGSPQ